MITLFFICSTFFFCFTILHWTLWSLFLQVFSSEVIFFLFGCKYIILFLFLTHFNAIGASVMFVRIYLSCFACFILFGKIPTSSDTEFVVVFQFTVKSFLHCALRDTNDRTDFKHKSVFKHSVRLRMWTYHPRRFDFGSFHSTSMFRWSCGRYRDRDCRFSLFHSDQQQSRRHRCRSPIWE